MLSKLLSFRVTGIFQNQNGSLIYLTGPSLLCHHTPAWHDGKNYSNHPNWLLSKQRISHSLLSLIFALGPISARPLFIPASESESIMVVRCLSHLPPPFPLRLSTPIINIMMFGVLWVFWHLHFSFGRSYAVFRNNAPDSNFALAKMHLFLEQTVCLLHKKNGGKTHPADSRTFRYMWVCLDEIRPEIRLGRSHLFCCSRPRKLSIVAFYFSRRPIRENGILNKIWVNIFHSLNFHSAAYHVSVFVLEISVCKIKHDWISYKLLKCFSKKMYQHHIHRFWSLLSTNTNQNGRLH